MEKNRIPKKIHYCWFGRGEKSNLAERCLESWRKRLKDYEIIEWNEENFNINVNRYVSEAYNNKKYAFVSDYVRLFVLSKYGGIYLDTDVEVLKNFDEFLNEKGFIGFEDEELISTAVIGAKKDNKIIKEWLDTYNNRSFIENGKMNELTNVRVITNILLKYGIKQNNTKQDLCKNEISIYPSDYFSPLKIGSKKPNITTNTISIHWFEGTWINLHKKVKIKIITKIKNIIGFKNYNKIKKIIIGKS